MPPSLRDYQHDAIAFLTHQSRTILADEVGLGKTPPTILAAVQHASGSSKLVVCPAYLMRQWRDAIHLWSPAVEPVRVLERADPPADLSVGGWIIISYNSLMNAGVSKHPELLRPTWPVVIFDEAHRLRGRNSQWTKNAYKLKADKMFFLTGTPIVNNPSDLWPILRLCEPKTYTSYWRFVDEWCVTQKNPWKTEILGLRPEKEAAWHKMLDKWLLCRRVEDHLPELPPQIDHVVRVDLPKATKKAHDNARRDWFIEHPDLTDRIIAESGGALILRLRQLTAGTLGLRDGAPHPKENPKRDAVLDLLSDKPNDPAIVFSYFRDTASLLAEALVGARPVFLCTGDSTPKKRAEAVEEWKRTRNGVIVATIPALQEGANLQHASTVVFAEHSYLPTDVVQAVARCRRYGQLYPVNVYHILCAGTVDESVWRAMQKREKINDRALLADLKRETGLLSTIGKALTRLASAIL